MQRFTPNTVLYDRFLLKKELSYESQSEQQIWAVQDRQTGQSLIARLHANGRVEWFNDNRSDVPAAPAAASPVTQPVATPRMRSVAPSLAPPPKTPSGSKRALWFLLIMLLLGGLTGGYLCQKPLLAYVRSLRLTNDSTSLKSVDSTATVSPPSNKPLFWDPATPTKSVDATSVETEPSPVDSEASDVSASASISVPQALRMLNLLKQIPAEKHAAVFRDARQAFTDFRRKPGRQSSIDSLYTICMGRGAQSFLAHQQNGDAASQRYAIEWYQLAYALKPSAYLEERLDRLRSNGRPSQRKTSVSPKKASESMFMRDPEVNR